MGRFPFKAAKPTFPPVPTPTASVKPSRNPTKKPTQRPSKIPTRKPTQRPSKKPTCYPSFKTTNAPTSQFPVLAPTQGSPISTMPTMQPTMLPSTQPIPTITFTLAGGGGSTNSGYANGLGTFALFSGLVGIDYNNSNNDIFVSDGGNLRVINSDGLVSILAGCNFDSEYGQTCGYANGIGTFAEFDEITGVCYDPAAGENLYVGDFLNYVIREISPIGATATFAGTPLVAGTANGQGTYAQFAGPNSMTFNAVSGTFFVPDDGTSNVIRQISLSGSVSLFAGALSANGGYQNGVGTYALFNFPSDLTANPVSGNLYVVDSRNSAIRQITLSAVVTTLAGPTSPGLWGYANGIGTNGVYFSFPYGITYNPKGILYIGDSGNNVIRQIELSTSAVSLVAGNPTDFGYADGIGTYVLFKNPTSLVYNNNTNQIYVSDFYNNLIRVVTFVSP